MGHSFNLAVQDTCRSLKVMSDTFVRAIKYSAKKALLLNIKVELAPATPGVEPLCPTWWTVRTESLWSVMANYEVTISVLEEILDECTVWPKVWIV